MPPMFSALAATRAILSSRNVNSSRLPCLPPPTRSPPTRRPLWYPGSGSASVGATQACCFLKAALPGGKEELHICKQACRKRFSYKLRAQRLVHSAALRESGAVVRCGDASFEGTLAILLKHKHNWNGFGKEPEEQAEPPLLPLEAFDAYRRHIRHLVELAVGCQRQSEFKGGKFRHAALSFRSLRLVTRSMSGLHAFFLLMLLGAPPTSLELLLTPHAQFCCLCLAQAASTTFWGFGISRPGPLMSGGLAVGDWRLAMGLAYLWLCAIALMTTLSNPQASYGIQIPALILLLLFGRRLGSPRVGGVPEWWATGSHQRMLIVLLACVCAALGRALYVERTLDSIMERAMQDG
ncbi:hypothetical protein Efla_000593 [Eimeria flavescens]